MKTKEFKGTKGITLLSLAVTIIILLVLIGVTLNLVVGEEGVIKRAINARDVYSVQEALEKIKLAVSSAQIAGVGEIEENELKNDLKRYFGNDCTIEGDYAYGWIVTLPKQGIVYNIDPKGTIEEEEQPVDNSGNFLLGLVDDLGTRSTIYLYANPENTTAGQKITITMPNGEKISRTLNGGELNVIPLAIGEVAKIHVKPKWGFDMGNGDGKEFEGEVHGGVVGVIFDTRGRPFTLPKDNAERVNIVKSWYKAMNLYPGL